MMIASKDEVERLKKDRDRLNWIEHHGYDISCQGPEDIEESLFDDVWKVDGGVIYSNLADPEKTTTHALVSVRVGLRNAIDAAIRKAKEMSGG